MPPEFGRDVDRLLVLELGRELDADEAEPPDAAAELADAVTRAAARDRRRDRRRPGRLRAARLPAAAHLAAAADRGDAAARRGDPARRSCAARLAADLRERLPLADDDRELGEALDRWELSLFAEEPFRSAQVREALDCLLGERRRPVGRRRCARPCCSAEKTRERSELARVAPRRAAAGGTRATRFAGRSSRRCCTATARSSSRARRDAARAAAAAGVDAARRAESSCAEAARTRHTFPATVESVDAAAPGARPARAARAARRARAAPPARDRSRSSARSCREAEAWARAEGDRRALASRARNFERRAEGMTLRRPERTRTWVSPACSRVPTFALRARPPPPPHR